MSACGATGNDGGLTKVFMRVDKPKGLGAIGTGLAETQTMTPSLKAKWVSETPI